MSSYLEASGRARITQVLDPRSFHEILPPSARMVSPHLGQLDAPVAFDDGVIIGAGTLDGLEVLVASQEGRFMGGAVGEVHGAKLVGLLRRALNERPTAVLLLLETGGVRLHEANAGLIAVSEVMRAVLDVRAAGIPVVVLIGGGNGCFGGMGIVARCANAIIMSEEGRLGMSGPEVIETANGVEEFDSRDRALVWRTTGGKHRYLMGDCQRIVADDVVAFRDAAAHAVLICRMSEVGLTLAGLQGEQSHLEQRISMFEGLKDPAELWERLGIADTQSIPLLEAEAFERVAAEFRMGSQ